MDRAQYVRESRGCLRQLEAATRVLGTSGAQHPVLVAQQHERVAALAYSLERLANVKEFRTPQGARSVARLYVGLIIPIFFGPYWGWVSNQTNFGFAFFFSIVVRVQAGG